MYLEAIKFKREENSEWETGYYVGKFENCYESVILDSNYKPLEKDGNEFNVWDYRGNSENRVKISIPDQE